MDGAPLSLAFGTRRPYCPRMVPLTVPVAVVLDGIERVRVVTCTPIPG